MRILPLLAALLLINAAPLSATRCRVDSVRSVHHLLAEAHAVVRIQVNGAAPPATADVRQHRALPADQIEVSVLEVLKGSDLPERLVTHGRLVEHDDFNDRRPPYSFVRPAGRRGSCYATEYRVGGEYILILRSQNGRLSPYWAALAPTNEQVHGPDDPWVWWVRGYLAAHARASASHP